MVRLMGFAFNCRSKNSLKLMEFARNDTQEKKQSAPWDIPPTTTKTL
jgi:hypothetical protein